VSSEFLGTIATLLTALVAVAGGLFAAYKYFSKRERFVAIRTAFSETVAYLDADDPVHRRVGAIMLRRFFDERTEQGGQGTPYASEALGVIAATLKDIETGPFQKLLADGLAHAPTLEWADLQKTNLQGAFLVKRGEKGEEGVDLRKADFFRADLTDASLRLANANDAVFFQARLVNAVLRSAHLCKANFSEADLLGANFDGASLNGASFANARNVPEEIRVRLDEEGHYAEGRESEPRAKPESPMVFLSKPGAANVDIRQVIGALVDRVQEQDLEVVQISPSMYATAGAVAEVRRVMSGCAGVVVVAVPDLEVRDGAWRQATPQARDMSGEGLTTPWTNLELGLAIGLGLPVLLAIADGVNPEAFDYGVDEPHIHPVGLGEDHLSRLFRRPFDDWCGAVREQARRQARPPSRL
jgi:uncharacterized protein YjbI with pentapeptide repeats